PRRTPRPRRRCTRGLTACAATSACHCAWPTSAFTQTGLRRCPNWLWPAGQPRSTGSRSGTTRSLPCMPPWHRSAVSGRASAVRPAQGLADTELHVLDLQVFQDGIHAALAADAGLLVATEGRVNRCLHALVDGD